MAKMHSSLQALVAALPRDIAKRVRAALPLEPLDRAQALIPALKAAAYPEGEVYPLPESLTPTQRLLAEIVAHEVSPPFIFAFPTSARTMRTYLGFDPPGPCEAPVVVNGAKLPIWRAMQDLDGDPDAQARLLDAMKPTDGARTFVALALSSYRFRADDVLSEGRPTFLEKLGRDAAAWARDAGDALLAERAKPGHRSREEEDLAELVIATALTRSGKTEDPRFDALVPASSSAPNEAVVERVMSLPEARRVPAALQALARKHMVNVPIGHGLALLEKLDSVEIARAILGLCADFDGKARVKKELDALAKTRPGVKRALDDAKRGAPAAIALQVIAVKKPSTVKELDAIEKKQLRLAGKSWDGKDRPVEERLGKDETAFSGILEKRTLAGADGKPRYDAWLFAGDSGAYFDAGTTKEIAGMIQGSVELNGAKDPPLRDALQEASAGRVAKAGKKKAKPK
jgi:hypothetical protein